MKRVFWTLGSAVLVMALAMLVVMYAGLYNVAARSGESPLVRWVLSTTMDHSVRTHASGIAAPDLNDSALVALGYDHFTEMCVSCHGSPAGGRSEAGTGLDPPAPELSSSTDDWTAGELFWIVKNGIKMTGMPAFGPTHSDREVWAIVAFLKKLEGMSPAAYHAYDSLMISRLPQHGGADLHHEE